MSKSPVINSLRRKRAEISGLIRELDARIHDLRRDLGHIDATLKLFDPEAEPVLIKPVRPYRPRNRIFARKELSIRVMNAVREAKDGFVTLDSIVARIVADKGLDEAATGMVRARAMVALKVMEARGIAAKTKEKPFRWEITP